MDNMTTFFVVLQVAFDMVLLTLLVAETFVAGQFKKEADLNYMWIHREYERLARIVEDDEGWDSEFDEDWDDDMDDDYYDDDEDDEDWEDEEE